MGKDLKDAVLEKDRLFRETGYAYGLQNLELVEDDPAKFMRFQLSLVAACVSAKEMAKLVTASPAGLQMGELLFMLATPEGDCVSGSYGLIGHLLSTPFIIRHMAHLGFERNPGIREGDIFACSDPYYGVPHNSDHYAFVPVFYNDELVAWTVGMNHILDSGGISPGSWGVLSFNTFTDGFQYPPMKTGENFELYKYWELLWHRRTRTGAFNAMDDKMRVTGVLALRERVLTIIKEFGVDYFRCALREMLERERRLLLNRIKALAIPGKYGYLSLGVIRYKGVAGRLFPRSDRDWLLHEPADFYILADGRIFFDLAGLSSEDDFYLNAYEPALRMGVSLGCWPMFAHTVTLNTALLYVVDFHVPPGSMFNPVNPFASALMGIGEATNYLYAVFGCLTQSYFARGFLEESFQLGGSGGTYGMEGTFADGFRWASADMPHIGAASTAATPYKDGEVAVYSGAHPQSDLGEVESSEFAQPTNLNIGRKIVANYCGHGKFRGGLALAITQLIVDPGQSLVMSCFAVPKEVGVRTIGMSGGYPGPNPVIYFAHDTNMMELIDKGETYPRDFVEIEEWIKQGKLKAGSIEVYNGDTPNIECRHGDIFCAAESQQGGWGDPIERSYELVERDVRYGWVTPNVARTIYGVAVDSHGKVDLGESLTLRREIKRRRLDKSLDVKDWWSRERALVSNSKFSELVYDMYADILNNERFRSRFTDFWQLPGDYNLEGRR